jgi:hypothetical protein
MRVLTLTLEKKNYANFSLVFVFYNVKHPDGSVTRPNARDSNGRTARLNVRTRVTCPHISEATRVRTGLMSHPDGDPTASIKRGRRIFSLPHSFSHSLLAVCECFLTRFCFFSPSFVLLCITHHIPGIFFFC